MRTVRFYCPTIESLSLLDPVESAHLSRVLRLSPGDPVELFDGRGTLAAGVVEQIRRNQVSVRVTDRSQSPPPAAKLILAVSCAKGQRFDWLIEKCTELGADHIAAVQFDRTVKLSSAAAVERLSKITIAAAKQCQRLYLPVLTGPAKLHQTAEALQTAYPQSTRIYGSPQGQALHKTANIENGKDTVVFIGPEGGFSDAEIEYFQAQHIAPVRIHRNILRVETAAAAFCALLSSR